MRELKFRIWDKKNKIFIYEWDASHKRLAISLVGLVYHGGYDDVLPENDYVVQQWTGLKDLKGIEIYEGDIIETMYDVSCFKLKNGEILEGAEPGHFMIEKPVLSKVKWSGVGFDLGGKIQIGWRKKDAFKVVGNLFETPELLK